MKCSRSRVLEPSSGSFVVFCNQPSINLRKHCCLLSVRLLIDCYVQGTSTEAIEAAMCSLRLVAHLAQQESPMSQLPSLSWTCKNNGGGGFSNRAYETAYGAWELLTSLSTVMDERLHKDLEASSVFAARRKHRLRRFEQHHHVRPLRGDYVLSCAFKPASNSFFTCPVISSRTILAEF